MPRRKSRSKTAPTEEPVEAEATAVEQASDGSDQPSMRRSSRHTGETSRTSSSSSTSPEWPRRSTTAGQAEARVTRSSLTRAPPSISPSPTKKTRGYGSTQSPALRVKSSPRVGSKISYQEDSEGEEGSHKPDPTPGEEEDFQMEEEVESDSEESRDAGKRKATRSRQSASPRTRRSSSGKKGGRGRATPARAKKSPKTEKEVEDRVPTGDKEPAGDEIPEAIKEETPVEVEENTVTEELSPKRGRRRSTKQTDTTVAEPAPASDRAKRSRTRAPKTPSPARRSSRVRKTLMEDVKDSELDEEEEDDELGDASFKIEDEKDVAKPRSGLKRKAEDDVDLRTTKSNVESAEVDESKMDVDEDTPKVEVRKLAHTDVDDMTKASETKDKEKILDEKVKGGVTDQPVDADEPNSTAVKAEDNKKDGSFENVEAKENTTVAVEKDFVPEVGQKKEIQALQGDAKSEAAPVNKSPITPKSAVQPLSTNFPKQSSPVVCLEKKLPAASSVKVQPTAPQKVGQPVGSSTKPAQQGIPVKPVQSQPAPPKSTEPQGTSLKPDSLNPVQAPTSPSKSVQPQKMPAKPMQLSESSSKGTQPLPALSAKVVQPPVSPTKTLQAPVPPPKSPQTLISIEQQPKLLATDAGKNVQSSLDMPAQPMVSSQTRPVQPQPSPAKAGQLITIA